MSKQEEARPKGLPAQPGKRSGGPTPRSRPVLAGLGAALWLCGLLQLGCGGRTNNHVDAGSDGADGDSGVADGDMPTDADEWDVTNPEAHQDTWLRVGVGGEHSGQVNAVLAARNGDILLGGSYRGWLWVARLDVEGRVIWERLIGEDSTGENEAFALAETESEEIVVFGIAGLGRGFPSSLWLAVLDAEGSILWQRFVRGILRDSSAPPSGLSRNAMALVGDVVVVKGYRAGDWAVCYVGISLDGALIWQFADAMEGSSYLSALFTNSNDQVHAVRWTPSEDERNIQRIVRFDSSGMAIAGYELTPPCGATMAYLDRRLRGGLEHPDGGYVLYGYSAGRGDFADYIPWIARYDEDWGLLWAGYFEDDKADEVLTGMAVSPEGGLVGVGMTRMQSAEDTLYGVSWITRLTADRTVATSVGGIARDAFDVALQGDRILVGIGGAGRSWDQPLVARLTLDGQVEHECGAIEPYPMTFVECDSPGSVVEVPFTGVEADVEVQEGTLSFHEVPSRYDFVCPSI